MDSDERKILYDIMKEIVEKYKDKPLLYKKMKRASLTFDGNRTVHREIYQELANLTTKINFRCNFKDNKCRANRSEMCCCSSCASCFGHFNTIFFSAWSDKDYIEKEMLYYAKIFRIKTGFWRKGKGCILPRHRRSTTCLIYNCNNQNLTFEEKLVLDIIHDYNKYPPYIRSIIKMLKDHFLYKVE